MVVVKEPHCDTNALNEIIISHVPTAEIESQHAGELSYVLPRDMSSHFEQLFTELETKQRQLGVGSFGVSVTTMEEVFLKVGEQYDISDSIEHNSYGSEQTTDVNSIKVSGTSRDSTEALGSRMADSPVALLRTKKPRLNTGFSLAFQQFRAMLVKRFHYSTRYKMAILTQLFLPIAFTLVGLILAKTEPGPRDSPPRVLTAAQFQDNYALVYADNTSRLSNESLAGNLSNIYFDQFLGSRTVPVDVSGNMDLSDYVRQKGESIGFSFNNKYLIAGSFESDDFGNTNVTAWFNNQAFHAIEVALTSIDNAIMSLYSNGQHTINVTNYPLPRTVKQVADDLNT